MVMAMKSGNEFHGFRAVHTAKYPAQNISILCKADTDLCVNCAIQSRLRAAQFILQVTERTQELYRAFSHNY